MLVSSGNYPSDIDRFKACLSPIVRQNEQQPASKYIRFGDMFGKIKRDCAIQRLSARDSLAAFVAARIREAEGREMPADDEWKEDLIDEATIRWMNNATVQAAYESEN